MSNNNKSEPKNKSAVEVVKDPLEEGGALGFPSELAKTTNEPKPLQPQSQSEIPVANAQDPKFDRRLLLKTAINSAIGVSVMVGGGKLLSDTYEGLRTLLVGKRADLTETQKAALEALEEGLRKAKNGKESTVKIGNFTLRIERTRGQDTSMPR